MTVSTLALIGSGRLPLAQNGAHPIQHRSSGASLRREREPLAISICRIRCLAGRRACILAVLTYRDAQTLRSTQGDDGSVNLDSLLYASDI
jgi:hypothetical protein